MQLIWRQHESCSAAEAKPDLFFLLFTRAQLRRPLLCFSGEVIRVCAFVEHLSFWLHGDACPKRFVTSY